MFKTFVSTKMLTFIKDKSNMKIFICIIKTSFGFRPDHFKNYVHMIWKLNINISTKRKIEKFTYSVAPVLYRHTHWGNSLALFNLLLHSK